MNRSAGGGKKASGCTHTPGGHIPKAVHPEGTKFSICPDNT